MRIFPTIFTVITLLELTVQIIDAQLESWKPCQELSRELRIPCRCLIEQTPSLVIHLDCDRVVFVGGDISVLPYGAPIVSISQRWAGRQVLPTRALSNSALPLGKLDFSGNSLRRLTERLLFSLRDSLTDLRLADNLLGDSLNPIFSTTELHGLTHLRLLDLSGNHIKGIEEGIFKGCESLQELYLDRNSLTLIPNESLNGPKALKLLSLRKNRIEIIHNGAFYTQPSIEMVDLSDNIISTIEHGAFLGLSRLRVLRLRRNHLTKFNSDIFEGAINLHTLDLSQNFISEFPTVAIKMFSNLKHLNLSSNIIKNLSNSNFESLETLETLVLSRNNIANIAPGTFLGLRKLKYLDISVNSLRAIEDDAFEGLEYLSAIDLTDNNILVIPASALGRLLNISSLYLECNRIAAVSSDILRSVASNTKELSFSQNVIRELPSATFQHFKKLEKLDLSKNLLSTLNSDAYAGLDKILTYLKLSQNRISTIVGPPLSLTHLKHLDISDNRISDLPKNFLFLLPNLEYLNISQNQHLHSVSTSFLFSVTQLKVFDASQIGMKNLQVELFSKNKKLQKIYLSHNNLTELSEGSFVNMGNLSIIDLSYNRIVNIRTSTFINIMNIQKLSLRGNMLNAFKGEFFNTGTSLEHLDLSDNQISYIFPSSFRIHPRLKHINVARNKFNFFPAELIASLQYLEFIDISGNGLKVIGELDFARLPRLRTLILKDNQLETVSEMSFHNSTQLQILDLSNNSIERLADRTFEGLARLELLNLGKNSLSELPETLFDRSRLHMLENIILAHNEFEAAPLKALQRQYFFLSSVDLSHNHLTEIPQDSSIMVNIKRLDLSFNPLTETSVLNLLSEPKTVRELNIARTGIKSLIQLETPFLTKLNLSLNNISSLPDKFLERATLLENLDLSHNKLTKLEPKIWSKLKYLEHFNISANPIESIVQGNLQGLEMLSSLHMHTLTECIRIEKNAFIDVKNLRSLEAYNFPKLGYLGVQGILQNLPFLQHVNIEIKDSAIGNDQLESVLHPRLEFLGLFGPRLHSIASGTLSGLKTDQIVIELRNTSLTSLPPTFFFSMPRSTKIILDITGSQLTTLSPQLLVALEDRRKDVTLLGLETNPIVCDCGVRALRRWLPSHMTTVRCVKPEHLSGKLLIEIGDDQLTCDSRPLNYLGSSTSTFYKVTHPSQVSTTEPQIIWSVPPVTTKKRMPITSSVVNAPPPVSNDDTLIIGIVGGVVAFIIILIIIICIIRLRMSSTTQYRGGPMANGAPPAITNSSCACSVMKNGCTHSLYVPSPTMYAATLPHRPVSAAAGVRPIYATMGSRASPYIQPHPYLMVMPQNEEKIYR